jgi:SAM-dependent methyltransferase
MNTKILTYILKNLDNTFSLDHWADICSNINKDTNIKSLPWTLTGIEKFEQDIKDTFDVVAVLEGSVADLVEYIDTKYATRFWGSGVWQPKTDIYQYTGWGIVEEINKLNPKKVLDVGCGYNQFKPHIPNLVGIDKFNNSADYMVGILEYEVEPNTYDAVIVLGSINFGEYADILASFRKVVEITAPGGRIYVRANPGETHKNGPWIHIFPWDFEAAQRVANDCGVELVTFKKDNGNRLFFLLEKK